MSNPFQDESLLFTPANPDPDAVPVVFAFPNEYTVGITSLGFQVVWAKLAMRRDLSVRRLFTDIQESGSQSPELFGVSLSWELDYGNVLGLLEGLKIPIWAEERGDNHPLIFGGGPVLTANPEPFAAFFDIILLGDGEDLLDGFIDAYQCVRGKSRQEKLLHLVNIPGIYIPSLYEVEYESPDGAIVSIAPKLTDVPENITKQTYRGNVLSASTVVTPKAAWENIFMVEVVRSCPEMCRFCLASYLTLPFRPASIEESLIPAIDRGLQVTRRLGLLGASVTQHPEFDKLLDYINEPKFDDVRMSVSSVRTNTVTEKLAKTLVNHDSRSITIAVESGSERMRNAVNKKLTQDEITNAAVNAKAGGLSSLKLYGMVGLPSETDEDLEATTSLLKSLKKSAPGLRLTWGCSTFVPKAHTPFQWYGVSRDAEKRLQKLQKQLRPQGIEFRPESYNWSVIQCLLSRGDRRLSKLLELTRHYGDTLGSYRRAFKELKGQLPTMEFYVHEEWSVDQILPWNHLQGPLSVATLDKHRASAEVYFAQSFGG